VDKMPRPALAAALRNQTVAQASQLCRVHNFTVSRLRAPQLLIEPLYRQVNRVGLRFLWSRDLVHPNFLIEDEVLLLITLCGLV
jgi:hypothetical protein